MEAGRRRAATPETEALDRRICAELDSGSIDTAVTLALEELGPGLLGYMASVLRDEDAARDVFGVFSEELWKSAHSFRRESSFKTWAYRIAWHCLRGYQRDAYRKRGRRLEEDEMSAIALSVRSVTSRFRHTEVKDGIAQLRGKLSREEQTLLVLRIDRAMRWTEVAVVMADEGKPLDPAALRKRFERIKARLREEAQRAGLLDER